MEDTLREFGNVLKIILLSVLILVLMEDTLRAYIETDKGSEYLS